MGISALPLLLAFALSSSALAQQPETTKTPEAPRTSEKKKPETPSSAPASQAKTPEQPAAPEAKPEAGKDSAAEEHYEMAEVSPIVTHHQVTVDSKLLHYTATTGRLPIKRETARSTRKCSSSPTRSTDRTRPSVR